MWLVNISADFEPPFRMLRATVSDNESHSLYHFHQGKLKRELTQNKSILFLISRFFRASNAHFEFLSF